MKHGLQALARSFGQEARARRGYFRVRRLTEDRVRRRARIDDEHLRIALAAALTSTSNCVDVGANVGSVLDLIVHLAPHGHHIAFEPLPDLCEGLRRRFPRVDVRGEVVSDRAARVSFQRHLGVHSRSSLRVRGGGPVEELSVEAVRLDDALPRGFSPALIKIDVEGAEHLVLQGALETLRRHRPIVVLEHGDHAIREFGATHEQIFDLLVDDAGLAIFDMDGNGPFAREEFARIASPPGERFNFLARA